MKGFFTYFIFAFLFSSINAIAQDKVPYKYMRIESRDLVFEKVYELDSLSAKDIEQLLSISVPTTKDIANFVKTGEVMTAKIEKAEIDYRRYGGKGMSVVTYMNFPMYASVAVVWKDNKYKVTVSNMVFHTSLGKITGGESFGASKATRLDTSNFTVKSGRYLEQYLSDLFRYNKTVKSDW